MSNHCVGVTTAESEFRSSLQVVGVRGDLRKKKKHTKENTSRRVGNKSGKGSAATTESWSSVLLGNCVSRLGPVRRQKPHGKPNS